ncbi:battenin CLN3 protein [Tulasnella sp. 425]|nr:battenin CLN3 protein [Tulasnella sp. 425]
MQSDFPDDEERPFRDSEQSSGTLAFSPQSDDQERKLRIQLGVSFFLFGLINNILYVVILSAALDLVPPATPKGIIAFCNIAPSFAAKVGWPYILKGRIRYTKRIVGCCFCSVMGMLVVAGFESLGMRLLGICLASFSSGLGELTFLQLSTTYPIALAGHSVGYFASGTGGAGVGGAGLWWELRSLGVKRGISLCGFLPFVIPLAYFFLLPPPTAFQGAVGTSAAYAAIPTADLTETPAEEIEENDVQASRGPKIRVTLSVADKLRLVRPLLLKYMLPLFLVYTIEYTINQGIAPTLLYPVPDPSTHPVLRLFIKSVRDYYPLWQLVYQTFVFFSRSSISLGLPALPTKLLWLPAFVQSFVFIALSTESARGIFPDDPGVTIFLIFCLIAVEGFCGGLAYVNVFYRIGQEDHPEESDSEYDVERKKQEREFKIGSIGVGDSLGIMLASLLAMPTEIGLCKAQVARGKDICRTL